MALRAKANVPAFQSDHHDINAFDCDHHDDVETGDDGNSGGLVLALHLPESLKTILSYVLWRCRGFPHA